MGAVKMISSYRANRARWTLPGLFLFFAETSAISPRSAAQENATGQALRIIVFGAHPDDCELEAGGTAARWAKLGYKVKFVSVTNGDIGHHELAGAIIARRRTDEVKKCAQILGIETDVLD